MGLRVFLEGLGKAGSGLGCGYWVVDRSSKCPEVSALHRTTPVQKTKVRFLARIEH